MAGKNRAAENSDDAGTPPSNEKSTAVRRFESALAEVESIVMRLESGDLELEEALDQYQRGIESLKQCHRILASAERRITLLSGFDAEGNPIEAPFDEEEMTLSEKQTRRGTRRGAARSQSAGDATDAGEDEDESSQEGSALF